MKNNLKDIIRITFLMFILISFFTSCKKTVLKIKVRGEVVGLTGGEPIPDADVYIIRHQETDMFSYGISEEVYRSKTNHKGEFEFDFKRERGWKYTLYARKKEYFDEESTRGVQSYIVLDQLGSPLNRKVKLYLCEPAFVDVHLINVTNYSPGNKFSSFSFYKMKGDPILTGIYLDCSIKDTLIKGFIIPSGSDFKMEYNVKDSLNNILQNKSATIQSLSSFKEFVFKVEY